MLRKLIYLFFILIICLSYAFSDVNEDLLDGALYGDPARVKEALASGADINTKDINGATALMITLHNIAYFDLTLFLLRKGADINAKEHNGNSVLMYALKRYDNDRIKFLIKKGADINAKNNLGYTVLMMSIVYNLTGIAIDLITKGVDVNIKNNNDYTALMMACESGNFEILKNLIFGGADLNIKNKMGKTAFDIASEKGFKKITEFLSNENIRKDYVNDELINSTIFNNIEKVKIAVAYGADVKEAKDTMKRTALDWAIINGNIEMIKFLFEKGAIYIPDEWIYARDIETVKFLYEEGLDFNGKFKRSTPDLIQFSSRGYLEIVKLLIQKGADVNAKDSVGNTALMKASDISHTIINGKRQYFDVVNLLIENKALVNAKNDYGLTALHLASGYVTANGLSFNPNYLEINDFIKIVKLLIDKGADINAKDNNGYTPLMIAVCASYIEFIKLLIKSGANVNIVTKDGYNALSFARDQSDNTEVIKLLLKAGSKEGKKIDQGTGM